MTSAGVIKWKDLVKETDILESMWPLLGMLLCSLGNCLRLKQAEPRESWPALMLFPFIPVVSRFSLFLSSGGQPTLELLEGPGSHSRVLSIISIMF